MYFVDYTKASVIGNADDSATIGIGSGDDPTGSASRGDGCGIVGAGGMTTVSIEDRRSQAAAGASVSPSFDPSSKAANRPVAPSVSDERTAAATSAPSQPSIYRGDDAAASRSSVGGSETAVVDDPASNADDVACRQAVSTETNTSAASSESSAICRICQLTAKESGQ